MKPNINMKDRRAERTHNSIRTAFAELIEKKNLPDITVTELADKAGIGRRTFYLHYQSVDDVVDEIENEVADEFIRFIEDNKVLDPDYDPQSLTSAITKILESNYAFYSKLALTNKNWFFTSKIRDALRAHLKNSKPDLSSKRLLTLTIYVEYVISGIMAAYVEWVRDNYSISMEEFAKTLSKIVYGGLFAATEVF